MLIFQILEKNDHHDDNYYTQIPYENSNDWHRGFESTRRVPIQNFFRKGICTIRLGATENNIFPLRAYVEAPVATHSWHNQFWLRKTEQFKKFFEVIKAA